MNIIDGILKNMQGGQPITTVYLNRCTLMEPVKTNSNMKQQNTEINCLVSPTIKNIPSTDTLDEISNFELRNIIVPLRAEND